MRHLSLRNSLLFGSVAALLALLLIANLYHKVIPDSTSSSLTGSVTGNCNDGIDNDGDGKVDALIERAGTEMRYNGADQIAAALNLPNKQFRCAGQGNEIQSGTPNGFCEALGMMTPPAGDPYSPIMCANTVQCGYYASTNLDGSPGGYVPGEISSTSYWNGFNLVTESCSNFVYTHPNPNCGSPYCGMRSQVYYLSAATCIANPPQCSDGRDNDHDGQIDYPADLGCASPNDIDERVNDPQCTSPNGSETPPVCGNGILEIGEQCDDRNAATPGCSSSCQIESGYLCPTAGQACTPKPIRVVSSSASSVANTCDGSIAALIENPIDMVTDGLGYVWVAAGPTVSGYTGAPYIYAIAPNGNVTRYVLPTKTFEYDPGSTHLYSGRTYPVTATALTPVRSGSGVWFTSPGYNANNPQDARPLLVGQITKTGVTTFPVTWTQGGGQSRVSNADITTDAFGNVWMTEGANNSVIKFNTNSGLSTGYYIATNRFGPQPDPNNYHFSPNDDNPTDLVSDAAGNIWFLATGTNMLGKIDRNGAITRGTIPTANSQATHIALGPDGNIWFTETLGKKIAKYNPSTGQIMEYPTRLTPGDIAVQPGSTDALWFTETGTQNKIAKITTSGIITEFTGNAGLIAVTPQGKLFFTQSTQSNSAALRVLPLATTISQCGPAVTSSVISSASSSTQTSSVALINAASCQSMSVPSTVQPGQSFHALVSFRNSGTKPWQSPDHFVYDLHYLTPQWQSFSAVLPNSPINPGSLVTFDLNLRAPTIPGTYAFDWQMLQNHLSAFGDHCTTSITVTALIPSLSSSTSSIAVSSSSVSTAVSTSSIGSIIHSSSSTVPVSSGASSTTNTSSSLAPIICGNGIRQEGEQCDDGSAVSGDGCNITCHIEDGYLCSGSASVCTLRCGNGMVDAGENCDDHNRTSGDGCSQFCQTEYSWICDHPGQNCVRNDTPQTTCGNSVKDVGETCDDGNMTPGDGCSAICQMESGYKCGTSGAACTFKCGDHVVDAPMENCDDGNRTPGDGCSANCQVEYDWHCAPGQSCARNTTPQFTCGNGVRDIGETCDDHNLIPGDGCNSTCQMESGYTCIGTPSVCSKRCGNGIAGEPGEQCDDGNITTGDGCTNLCQIESGWTCSVPTGALAGRRSVCTHPAGNLGGSLFNMTDTLRSLFTK